MKDNEKYWSHGRVTKYIKRTRSASRVLEFQSRKIIWIAHAFAVSLLRGRKKIGKTKRRINKKKEHLSGFDRLNSYFFLSRGLLADVLTRSQPTEKNLKLKRGLLEDQTRSLQLLLDFRKKAEAIYGKGKDSLT